MPTKGKPFRISPWVWEILYALSSFFLFLYLLKATLFEGNTSFGHDNYYWNYPLFHFFAESLMNGHLPLWNPYSHGGEPFFPILGQMRLLEPVAIFTVLIGKTLTQNIALLFNWHRIFHSLITYGGIYLCLRRYSKHLITRLALITILFFSSVMLGSFRCDGIIHDFLWCPYLLYFLIRIFVDQQTRWSHWLAMAGLIGINFQSYFFVPSLLLLLFFTVALVLFSRHTLLSVLKETSVFKKALTTFGILALMALPNLAVWQERNELSFPARTLPKDFANLPPSGASHCFEGSPTDPTAGIKMPYAAIEYTGTFLNLWNLAELLSPDGNRWIHSQLFPWKRWSRASEAYLYLGATTWILILVGIFLGKQSHKKIWISIFAGFTLYALGPPAGLHRLLYFIFPPTWFLRHSAYLSLFVAFTLLYFFVLGMNYLLTHDNPFQIESKSNEAIVVFVFAFGLTAAFKYLLDIRHPHEKYLWCSLLAIILILKVSARWLKREGIFLCLLLAHIGVLLQFHPHKQKFLVNLTLSLALPVLTYLLHLRFKERKTILSPLLGLFFILILHQDLLYRMKEVDVLYRTTLSPTSILEVDRKPLKANPYSEMQITPPPPKHFNEDYQAIRYPELLYRKPFAFSVLRDPTSNVEPFEKALRSSRWDYYLLLKNYQSLVHKNYPPPVLKALLGVDKPLFEFKSDLVLHSEIAWQQFFNVTDINSILGYLAENAIGVGPSANANLSSSQTFPSFISSEKSNSLDSNLPAPISADFSSSKTTSNWEMHFSHFSPNKVELILKTSRAGFLLWREGYDKHWHAQVDQKPVNLQLANFNHKGIFVAEGMHFIQFRYTPTFYLLSLIPFYLCVCICSIALLRSAQISPISASQKNSTYGLVHPI